MTKTKDFAEVIRHEMANDPKLRAEVEKQLLSISIATLIYNERSKAGLTQKELAKQAGTHQSVIARLEDADYGGHSLSMLWKIAEALGSELKIDFVPKNPPITSQASRQITSSALHDRSNTIEISYVEIEADFKVERSSANTPLTAVA